MLKQHTFKPQINANTKAWLKKPKEQDVKQPGTEVNIENTQRETLYSEPQMESF